jgi:hypothetical protein
VERYSAGPTKMLHSFVPAVLEATVSFFFDSLEIFSSGCFGISIYLIFSKKGTIRVYDHILSQHTFHIMSVSTKVWPLFLIVSAFSFPILL